MAGRLHLVRTSARVPPGLFALEVWEVLSRRLVVIEDRSPALPELLRQRVDVRRCGAEDDVLAMLLDSGHDDDVVWLVDADRPREETVDVDAVLHGWRLAGGEVMDHGPLPEVAGSHLLDLVAVMDVLRSPGGCPWDAEQTHESLLRYLVEEAYEVVDAVQASDDDDLREELGDLALQVVFHARIAQERVEAPWSVDDVADGIVAKLVRRHPHVFAPTEDHDGVDAQDVELRWKQLKAREKTRSGVLDGVPSAQPALLLAAALISRADDDAFDAGPSLDLGPHADDVAIGEHLLAVVRLAAAHRVDPEAALRAAVRRTAGRIDAAGAS